MCTRVLPTLELLISKWEDLLTNPEYLCIHSALEAGIALLEKYYQWAEDTDAYFMVSTYFTSLTVSAIFAHIVQSS